MSALSDAVARVTAWLDRAEEKGLMRADLLADLRDVVAAVAAPPPSQIKSLVEEARRLDAEATKGPWRVLDGVWIETEASDGRRNVAKSLCRAEDKDDARKAERDAAFIARARTLIPELAAALSSLLPGDEAALSRDEAIEACAKEGARVSGAPFFPRDVSDAEHVLAGNGSDWQESAGVFRAAVLAEAARHPVLVAEFKLKPAAEAEGATK